MREEKIPLSIFFTIALIGFWLIASTATFGFQRMPLIYTNVICGALLIAFGLGGRKKTTAFQIWGITAIGIWLQLSPLVFWAPLAASYINDTFVGCWVIALAITLHPMPGHTLRETPTIPPGWSYNPSSWPQRLPIAFLAFVCWMISRYLSAYQLGYIDTIWDPFFTPGTRGVLESSVSKAFPVSDAGLGAFAYTIEFFSACQGGSNRWRTAPWLVLIFGILVIPVSLISTLLIILQPLAVNTWCTLCLVTAICMLIAIPFAVGEVAATIQFLRYSKQKPFLSLLFRGGACPNETPDTISPSMDSPILSLLKASLSGMTLPWNLVLTTFLGVGLMAAPSFLGIGGLFYDINPIFGALVTVVSVVAFAEYARKLRWANIGLAAILLVITGLSIKNTPQPLFFLQAFFGIGIAFLSIRKGPVRERFSFRGE